MYSEAERTRGLGNVGVGDMCLGLFPELYRRGPESRTFASGFPERGRKGVEIEHSVVQRPRREMYPENGRNTIEMEKILISRVSN